MVKESRAARSRASRPARTGGNQVEGRRCTCVHQWVPAGSSPQGSRPGSRHSSTSRHFRLGCPSFLVFSNEQKRANSARTQSAAKGVCSMHQTTQVSLRSPQRRQRPTQRRLRVPAGRYSRFLSQTTAPTPHASPAPVARPAAMRALQDVGHKPSQRRVGRHAHVRGRQHGHVKGQTGPRAGCARLLQVGRRSRQCRTVGGGLVPDAHPRIPTVPPETARRRRFGPIPGARGRACPLLWLTLLLFPLPGS